MRFLIIFLFPLTLFARAENWTCIPDDGKTYSLQSKCPCVCKQFDPSIGHKSEFQINLGTGEIEINTTSQANRLANEQAVKNAANTKLQRLKTLKSKKSFSKSEQDEILIDLINRVN